MLWNLLSFLVALGILIAVHEWGHYWVARRCGVKVERFSLGFGKVLYSRKDAEGTEFSLSLIPLGGYVRMLDERVAPVPESLQAQAFNRQAVWKRFAIVAAGPLANFVFALFAFWMMLMIGVPSVRPVIGEVAPDSLAARSGLQSGMEFVAVNGEPTRDWEAVTYQLVRYLGQDEVKVTLNDEAGHQLERALRLDGWRLDGKEEQAPFVALGLAPIAPKVTLIVGQLVADGRAAHAGVALEDEVVALDGQPVTDWQQFVDKVQHSPEQKLLVRLRRHGEMIELAVTPAAREVNGKVVGYLGLAPKVQPLDDKYRITLQYDPGRALIAAGQRVADVMGLTLDMVSKLVTGIVSLDNLSGPISIAKGAGSTASYGLVYFLGFLGLVSINLGVINLFPLPVLDGGHLMFFVVEALRGKPVPEKIQEYAFKFGAAVLVCLMGIALFNDFVRL